MAVQGFVFVLDAVICEMKNCPFPLRSLWSSCLWTLCRCEQQSIEKRSERSRFHKIAN